MLAENLLKMKGTFKQKRGFRQQEKPFILCKDGIWGTKRKQGAWPQFSDQGTWARSSPSQHCQENPIVCLFPKIHPDFGKMGISSVYSDILRNRSHCLDQNTRALAKNTIPDRLGNKKGSTVPGI